MKIYDGIYLSTPVQNMLLWALGTLVREVIRKFLSLGQRRKVLNHQALVKWYPATRRLSAQLGTQLLTTGTTVTTTNARYQQNDQDKNGRASNCHQGYVHWQLGGVVIHGEPLGAHLANNNSLANNNWVISL